MSTTRTTAVCTAVVLALASVAAAAADVQVTPDLGRGNWRDFGLAEQYLEAGEEAMEAALPALRALASPS